MVTKHNFDETGGGLLPTAQPVTKLPAAHKALVAAARCGMTVEMAARHVGVAPKTLRSWLMKGAGEDAEGPGSPEHEALFVEWNQATAEFFADQMKAVHEAGAGVEVVTTETETIDGPEGTTVRSRTTKTTKKDWKAAAFLLERVFPDHMGPKRRPEREEGSRVQPRRVLVLGAIDPSCIVEAKVVDVKGDSDETRPKIKTVAHATDEATGLPPAGEEPAP